VNVVRWTRVGRTGHGLAVALAGATAGGASLVAVGRRDVLAPPGRVARAPVLLACSITGTAANTHTRTLYTLSRQTELHRTSSGSI